MDERKLKILYAVIESYTLNAEPVGSRTLSRDYDFGVGSATIRNEMSDLEEMGYLTKPHSSAGRIPSDLAYRLYVDYILDLLHQEKLDKEKRLEETRLEESNDESIRKLIKDLANITSYPALALVSKITDIKLLKAELVEVDVMNYLLLLIYDTQHVSHHKLITNRPLSKEEYEAYNGILEKEFSKISLEDAYKKTDRLDVKNKVLAELLTYTKAVLKEVINELSDVELIYEGISNIFKHPEYADVERARSFVKLIEDQELLLDIFSQNYNADLSVSIGEESKSDGLEDYSFVTAFFGPIQGTVGRFGVVGPKRMEYSNVLQKIWSLSSLLEK